MVPYTRQLMIQCLGEPERQSVVCLRGMGLDNLGKPGVQYGSGTVVKTEKHDYIATAFHVCSCADSLQILKNRAWVTLHDAMLIWGFENFDLAIYRLRDRITSEKLRYPLDNVDLCFYGGIGRALGFPRSQEANTDDEFAICSETGMPAPMPALVASYTPGKRGMGWCCGSISKGFSGGGLFFPAVPDGNDSNLWTLVGMITGRGSLIKHPIMEDDDGNPIMDKDRVIAEPTGMIRYYRIGIILRIIQTFEHIRIVHDVNDPHGRLIKD